jgi:hypothetical protein
LRVEQHEQPTAVVAADLLTDNASVLSGDIDQDHIGRQATRSQLDRRPDHLQLVFLTEQQAQREVQQPLVPDTRITLRGTSGLHLLTGLCWSTT